MLTNTRKCHDMIKNCNISLMYNGLICAKSIEKIADTLLTQLEFYNLPLSVSLSVFSVFVEQMNNVLMYSAEKGRLLDNNNSVKELSKGLFMFGEQGGEYFYDAATLSEANV